MFSYATGNSSPHGGSHGLAAVEGLFTKKEIDQMGSHFVEGFRRYIYPHLKGKGRSPYFHEPIKQDSAMVAGCLVIGYLFGTKWKRDPRARRMYNDALAQAGNLMWQSSPSGFDGDGFTYMRRERRPKRKTRHIYPGTILRCSPILGLPKRRFSHTC